MKKMGVGAHYPKKVGSSNVGETENRKFGFVTLFGNHDYENVRRVHLWSEYEQSIYKYTCRFSAFVGELARVSTFRLLERDVRTMHCSSSQRLAIGSPIEKNECELTQSFSKN